MDTLQPSGYDARVTRPTPDLPPKDLEDWCIEETVLTSQYLGIKFLRSSAQGRRRIRSSL